MLEPLDANKLGAIVCDEVCDEKTVDGYNIGSAKRHFAESDVIQGVHNLLKAFRHWSPHFYQKYKESERSHIQFGVLISVPHRAWLLTSIAGPSV